jgi:pimeloyl-ACP methyl ester carboxylesterase
MGGAIVTLISERYPELFTGMIAVGAALLIRKDPIDNPIKFLNKCQMPSLYLSNYTIEPVLYQIGRPGHGVLNLTEYLYAFDALMNWIDTKERPQDEECYLIEADPERNAVLRFGRAWLSPW